MSNPNKIPDATVFRNIQENSRDITMTFLILSALVNSVLVDAFGIIIIELFRLRDILLLVTLRRGNWTKRADSSTGDKLISDRSIVPIASIRNYFYRRSRKSIDFSSCPEDLISDSTICNRNAETSRLELTIDRFHYYLRARVSFDDRTILRLRSLTGGPSGTRSTRVIAILEIGLLLGDLVNLLSVQHYLPIEFPFYYLRQSYAV